MLNLDSAAGMRGRFVTERLHPTSPCPQIPMSPRPHVPVPHAAALKHTQLTLSGQPRSGLSRSPWGTRVLAPGHVFRCAGTRGWDVFWGCPGTRRPPAVAVAPGFGCSKCRGRTHELQVLGAWFSTPSVLAGPAGVQPQGFPSSLSPCPRGLQLGSAPIPSCWDL